MKFICQSLIASTFLLSYVAQAEIDSQSTFQKLVQISIDQGKDTQTEAGIYKVLSLESPSPQSNLKEYFSAVGSYDVTGRFEVDHIESVLEIWTKDGHSNSVIDQWDFSVDQDGKLIEATHDMMTETPDGQILTDKNFLPNQDAQTKAWENERVQLEKKFIQN